MSNLTNNFIGDYNKIMTREENQIMFLMGQLGITHYKFYPSVELLYREGALTTLDHIDITSKGGLRIWCVDKIMGDADCDARAFAYGELSKIIDVLNVEILHQSNEYKQLMKLLALEPNLRVECNLYKTYIEWVNKNGSLEVSSFSRDDRGNLQIYGDVLDTDGYYDVTLTERDIKPEYLKPLINYILDNANIINTFNGHDKELVRKINKAWKTPEYRERFGDILYAIGCRDKDEILEKLDIKIECNEDAMDNAHEIMEHVCDDMDLQTILGFVRYTEKKS